jgi:3-dehydroquinate synthase
MAQPELLDRQTRLLKACQLPVSLESAEPEEMLPVMMSDKKVAHGKLRFVLPTEIGNVDLVSGVEESAVVSAINACR